MRVHGMILVVAVLVGGCVDMDENPKWDPQSQLPSWTYDAPFYYRPSQDLQPQETIGDGIGVYYTRDDWFHIQHPQNAQPSGEPRIGVWYSTDRGTSWKQAGFFGVEQSHFLFRAQEDGEYWIRFVGPGQGVTQVPQGVPHRIYVVDRKPPALTLTLCGKAKDTACDEQAALMQAGEPVMLAWGVSDANLLPDSLEMFATGGEFPDNVPLARLNETISDEGSTTVGLPSVAARTGAVRFQLRATDKAGNVGLSTTPALPTAIGEPPIQDAQGMQTTWLTLPRGVVQSGWPTAGQFMRGGSEQTLRWVPEQAKQYEQVNLEFSANDGRDLTWKSVVEGLKVDQKATWTVPEVTSKSCRLRIVGILPAPQQGQVEPQSDEPRYVVLTISPRFTTDSAGIPPATQLGRQ